MEATAYPRVKTCCIGSVEEAWLAIASGASALGLVSAMPSGPGVVSEAVIAQVARMIPPGVSSVLLTSRQDSDGIIAQQRRTGASVIQITDRLLEGNYEEIHAALPGIGLMQVIHVTGPEAVTEAVSVAPFVQAFLFD